MDDALGGLGGELIRRIAQEHQIRTRNRHVLTNPWLVQGGPASAIDRSRPRCAAAWSAMADTHDPVGAM
jgi:hypothetical protein